MSKKSRLIVITPDGIDHFPEDISIQGIIDYLLEEKYPEWILHILVTPEYMLSQNNESTCWLPIQEVTHTGPFVPLKIRELNSCEY